MRTKNGSKSTLERGQSSRCSSVKRIGSVRWLTLKFQRLKKIEQLQAAGSDARCNACALGGVGWNRTRMLQNMSQTRRVRSRQGGWVRTDPEGVSWPVSWAPVSWAPARRGELFA